MILSKRKNLMSTIQKTVKASASLEIGERKVACRSRFPRPKDGDRRNQDFAGTKVMRRPQRLNCKIRGSRVGGPNAQFCCAFLVQRRQYSRIGPRRIQQGPVVLIRVEVQSPNISFSAVVLLGLSIGVASQTPPRPRRLGRNDEADQLEQRWAKINRTTAQAN
jgi:hypothetical protein